MRPSNGAQTATTPGNVYPMVWLAADDWLAFTHAAQHNDMHVYIVDTLLYWP